MKNKVLKAGSINVFSTILIKGINYLTLPIFIRIMPKEDFGNYSSFLSYIGIFSVFLSFGIHGLQKAAKTDLKDNLNSFISFSFLFCGVITIIFFVIISAFVFDLYFSIIVTVASYIQLIISICSCKLSVHFEYKESFAISVFHSIGVISLSLLLIQISFFQNTYLDRVYSLMLIDGIIAIIICCYFFLHTKWESIKNNWLTYLKYIIKLGGPLVLYLISNSILMQSDQIMILSFCGSESVANYSFAHTFHVILLTLYCSVEPTYSAWKLQTIENEETVKSKTVSSLLFCLLIFLGIGIITFAPELVKIIGGEKYADSSSLITPFVITVFLICLYGFYTEIEYYKRETKLMALPTIFVAVLNVILNRIFIPLYGYKIAAYTTVVSYFILVLIHLIISKRLFDTKKVYDEWIIWLITAISIIIAIFDYLCRNLLILRILSLIVMFCIIILVLGLKYKKIIFSYIPLKIKNHS